MKKLVFISILFIAFGLVTSVFAQEQVQSGKWSVNTSTAGYTLDKNEGERSVNVQINFDVPFDEKPDVILGVTLVDAGVKTNIRYNVSPMSISRDGFVIKIATWSDANIYGIGGYWMAHAKEKADKY
ncbi:H-type lectin domain protein [bacterium BMS3Abin03]|nr:H-type lectin domain protein [bacterium BMS3Abin03]